MASIFVQSDKGGGYSVESGALHDLLSRKTGLEHDKFIAEQRRLAATDLSGFLKTVSNKKDLIISAITPAVSLHISSLIEAGFDHEVAKNSAIKVWNKAARKFLRQMDKIYGGNVGKAEGMMKDKAKLTVA